MQVMLMRLMSNIEYLIVPKGTKFTGSGILGLMHPGFITHLLTFLATSAFSLLFPNNVGGFRSGICEAEDAEAAD